MSKKMKIGAGALIATIVIVAGVACAGGGNEEAAAPAKTVTVAAETPAPVETQPVEEDPYPNLTVAQENAVASASDYLDSMAFSKSGLVEQLEYEGFSKHDSKLAVSAFDTNAFWKKQAAAMAREYLDSQAFSHSGLVEQLEFEGFTTAQAEFGVTKAGL